MSASRGPDGSNIHTSITRKDVISCNFLIGQWWQGDLRGFDSHHPLHFSPGRAASAFRAGSRLALALSCLNAGILLLDGLVHAERLSTRYRFVTVVVALGFGAIGAAIFGLQWGLDRIRNHPTSGGDRNGVTEPAVPWLVVQLVLRRRAANPSAVRATQSHLMRALRPEVQPRQVSKRTAPVLQLPRRPCAPRRACGIRIAGDRLVR
jgi:hypothetical protein